MIELQHIFPKSIPEHKQDYETAYSGNEHAAQRMIMQCLIHHIRQDAGVQLIDQGYCTWSNMFNIKYTEFKLLSSLPNSVSKPPICSFHSLKMLKKSF